MPERRKYRKISRACVVSKFLHAVEERAAYYDNDFTILENCLESISAEDLIRNHGDMGTWRGTSRANLYAELGWESLNLRRWSRRLTLLYKIVNNLTPSYMTEPTPPLQQSHYTLSNPDVIERIRARTEKFKSSFYSSCLTEWND